MTEAKKQKTVRTTLDSLPYGKPDPAEASGRVKKYPFPENVNKSMIIRDVMVIALPSLVELILTQLTSMADQVMVGRLPGQAGIIALSAVGLAAQPKFLLMTMIQAMNVGVTAIVARFRGQQNQQRANQVFHQALILNALMAVFFMGVGLVFAAPLVRFISGSGISTETFQAAVNYFKIQMYGFIPLALSFTVTASLRGIGDTKIPLFYNTIANVVNLVFNYIMIYGHFGFPAMGVTGASWATVIGQTVAFLISAAVVLSRRRYIYLDFKEKFTFDRKLMGSVITIGVPSMIEQLFMRGGMIIYTRSVSSLGDTLYATHQICMSVQSMSFMMGQAYANASTTLMGQSLGKNRYDMAAIYMKWTRLVGVFSSLALAVMLILFNSPIIAFYNNTPEVIAIGSQILILIAFSQPVQSSQFIISGGLRGAGDTRYTALAVAVTVFGVRSLACVLMVNVLNWGLWGAWIALMVDQSLRTILMMLRYNSGKWKRFAI